MELLDLIIWAAFFTAGYFVGQDSEDTVIERPEPIDSPPTGRQPEHVEPSKPWPRPE